MKQVKITHGGKEILATSMINLRQVWEETSFRLEHFQTNTECVMQEAESMKHRTIPPYKLSFTMSESHCIGDFPSISMFEIVIVMHSHEKYRRPFKLNASFQMLLLR